MENWFVHRERLIMICDDEVMVQFWWCWSSLLFLFSVSLYFDCVLFSDMMMMMMMIRMRMKMRLRMMICLLTRMMVRRRMSSHECVPFLWFFPFPFVSVPLSVGVFQFAKSDRVWQKQIWPLSPSMLRGAWKRRSWRAGGKKGKSDIMTDWKMQREPQEADEE